jgi:4'-phosphopantetheinyl transferase
VLEHRNQFKIKHSKVKINKYNADFLNQPYVSEQTAKPVLKPEQVHLWTVSFDLPDRKVNELGELLSDEELKKAERFRFLHLKRQYIVFHATLRKILASYLGLNESEIVFIHNDYGKPAVAEHINPSNLQFSMSRSLETGVYAFMLNNEIGIDIERINPLPDMESIVNRHFSINEKNIFDGLDHNEKINWFYTVWTRKEALLKAVGTGLYLPLENIDVADVVNIKIDSDLYSKDDHSLNLADFKAFPEFKSAICVTYN